MSSGAPPPDDAELQLPDDPESVARTICLGQLDRRARSRAELETTLRNRGIPDDAAQRVLDRFAEVGLIDDASLAQSMAGAQHRERGLARRAVAAKLRQRGFDDETVSAAADTIDADRERARAEQLVATKRRTVASLPSGVQARRLVGMLARKGYPSGLAYEVVGAALSHSDPATADQLFDTGTLD